MSDAAWTDRLGQLHAALLACDSATLVLERWCGAPVAARRSATRPLPPDAAQVQRLGVASPAELMFRRVTLVGGGHTLSEAENWFVPARLTAEMVDLLARTETPFGHVVRALSPRRVTLSAQFGEPGGAVALEHRALLLGPQGSPIAEVRECYPWSLLDPG